MANLKDVIYISSEDYQTLVSTGTVVIGTETLTYDEDNLYLTPETQNVKSVNNVLPDSNGNVSITIPQGTVTSVDSISPTSGNVALSAVRYVSQSLTDAQKSQARTNIGAGTSNVTGSVVITSGSESVTINSNTLSFGANAFTNTAIPTTYVKSASASGNTLTITPSSGTALTYTPTFTEQHVGDVVTVTATSGSGIAIGGTTANPTVGVDSTHKFLDFVTASNIDYTRVTTGYGHLSLNSYEYGQGDTEGINLNLYNTAVGDDVLVVSSEYAYFVAAGNNSSYFGFDYDFVNGQREPGMILQNSADDSTYFKVNSSSIQHNGNNLQYAVEIIDLT